ncbi:hypothetical protein [Pseudomonas sp. yb_9]|uniref:hypothetical protein n=1 Tax=Pseudomonas sp. yb_9 TaxID=3367222 RepID=UPI00370BAD3B|nr:hypothetical protein [Pseudomonas putida]EKT4512132.1 hypothetical protein [Pseudomonas putida]
MSNYNWIAATVGMILALGMTRVVNSSVAIFRSRHRAKLHWIPFVWTLCIFYFMLDISWDLHNLSDKMQTWDFPRALILLGFVLVLFLAGALVLPQQELPEGANLKEEFIRDGRWTLIFVMVFNLLCIPYNWLLWKVPIFSSFGILDFILALIAFGALWGSQSKYEPLITLTYAGTLIVTALFGG